MISFCKIELKDKEKLVPYLLKENAQQCDYHFPMMVLWQEMFRYEYALSDGWLFLSAEYDEEKIFLMPLRLEDDGRDISFAVKMLEEYAAEQNVPLKFMFLEERHKEILEKALPGRFVFEANPDYSDYICLAQKMSTYSGRALRGKKRPCNHFESNYEHWSFVDIDETNASVCLELNARWTEDNPDKVTDEVIAENRAIEKALKSFRELELEGGILYAEDTPVGFTIGSMIREDTCDVLFEKADIAVDGSYPMVCREFTRMLMKRYGKLVYINREEDMGLDYLRKSKSMSDPEYFILKYTAVSAS